MLPSLCYLKESAAVIELGNISNVSSQIFVFGVQGSNVSAVPNNGRR
jgi:hypothetical protein